MNIQVFPHERIDDLQYKGLKIIQNPSAFCFGTDAVLLAHFADVRKGDRVVDLGTGTGILPILLAGRSEAGHITGLEIQQPMVEMASRSILLNGLEQRVQILQADLKEGSVLLGRGVFDVVVSNPPYKKSGSGMMSASTPQAISRHEILCTLEDVIKSASALLRNGGRFAMVHQTDRLMDILFLMRQYRMEPKRIRLIHPSINRAPNLLLLESIKGGKPHLKWMPPLIVFDERGNYTRELNEIYHRGDET